MGVTFDLSGIRRVAERVADTRKKAETALQRSKSTVARRIVPEVRRDMQTEYNLTATRINKGLTAKQTPDGVELFGSGRGVGLIEFGGKHSRRQAGASAQARKDESRHVYGGTFIAKGKSGNRQIFTRTRKSRLPIEPLYGPSIAGMLRSPGRADRVGEFAQKILASEIKRLLG